MKNKTLAILLTTCSFMASSPAMGAASSKTDEHESSPFIAMALQQGLDIERAKLLEPLNLNAWELYESKVKNHTFDELKQLFPLFMDNKEDMLRALRTGLSSKDILALSPLFSSKWKNRADVTVGTSYKNTTFTSNLTRVFNSFIFNYSYGKSVDIDKVKVLLPSLLIEMKQIELLENIDFVNSNGSRAALLNEGSILAGLIPRIQEKITTQEQLETISQLLIELIKNRYTQALANIYVSDTVFKKLENIDFSLLTEFIQHRTENIATSYIISAVSEGLSIEQAVALAPYFSNETDEGSLMIILMKFCKENSLSAEQIQSSDFLSNCMKSIEYNLMELSSKLIQRTDDFGEVMSTFKEYNTFKSFNALSAPLQQSRFFLFLREFSEKERKDVLVKCISFSPEKFEVLDKLLQNRPTHLTNAEIIKIAGTGLSLERYALLTPYLQLISEDKMSECAKFTTEQFSLLCEFLQHRTLKMGFGSIVQAVQQNLSLEQFNSFAALLAAAPDAPYLSTPYLLRGARYGLSLDCLLALLPYKPMFARDDDKLFILYAKHNFTPAQIESEFLYFMGTADDNTIIPKLLASFLVNGAETEQRIMRMLDDEDVQTLTDVSKFMIKNYRNLGLQLNHPLLEKAIDKMQNVLLESSDRVVLGRVCAFLLDSGTFDVNFVNYGFHEDHELIQTAIRQRIVLSQDLTDPTNPWKVWGDMLAKRDVDLNLSDLVPAPQPFAGKLVRLNAPAIADYAKDVAIVEASVPPIAPTALADLLGALAGRLNDGLRSTINDMTTKSFAEIRTNALGDGVSFLTNLLRAPKIGLLDAQFKCVMANVMSFPNDDGAEDKLSSQEEKLLKVLIGIAGCPTGQGGGVEAAYLNLPPQFKFETNRGLHGGLLAEQRKGKAFLMDLIKEASLTLLTNDNPFMRDITQEHEGNPIAELVHQGKYMINFIGDMVGINHPVTFNHHAGLFYQNMLALSKEETLRKFYDFAMADNKMVLFVKQKVQEMVDNRVGFEAFTSLKGDLTYKQMWGIKADSFKAPKLTDAGVLQLLLSINALQVIDSALPWGSSMPASSLPPVSSQ